MWRLQTSVVSMEKEETLNFCTAKKWTLQNFVVKKVDSANFCSVNKQTLQSSRGTLQNCTCNVYYKFCVITCAHLDVYPKSLRRARDHTWITLMHLNVDPKSHTSHIVMRLLSSSLNHLNHECAVPPALPQVTPTTHIAHKTRQPANQQT